MTTRNFIQRGQAYGATPASITATIDGTVVYTGTVPTVNIPVPTRPEESTTDFPTIFSWTNTVEFVGTQSYSITVSGSPLLLEFTAADNIIGNDKSLFGGFYSYETGGVTVYDPLTNVAIDGVVQSRGPDNTILPGQWEWLIPAGSTLTATLNVNAGVTGNV